MFGHGDHRVLRHFRACARGRGDSDKRQGRGFQRQALADHFQVVQHRARSGRERGDGLACVDHRTAAECDDNIRVMRARGFDAALHHVRVGFAGHRKARHLALKRIGQPVRARRIGPMDQKHARAECCAPVGGFA